jgi:spore coat protein U-like protein
MNKQARFTSSSIKLAALALAISAATGAMAATINATSSSTVVTPISITKAADLAFGSFASGSSSGTVTISPDGSRTLGGGALGVGTQSGTTTAAQFTVTGQSGFTYSISVSGTALTSGSDNMAFTPISALTASAITTGTVSSGTLTGGTQSIYVGGSLTVAANQAPGTYSGTVTATVDYN